jgi:hypothetical protein
VSRPDSGRATTRVRQNGELLLVLAALCVLVPPFVVVLNARNDAGYQRLKESGVVAPGTIKRKWTVTESYTGNGGRSRVRTMHRLEVGYDLNASTPYRQWKMSGRVDPAIIPAPTTADVAVSRLTYPRYAPGQQGMVVFAPGQAGSLMLVEQLEFRTSWQARLMWAVGLAAIMLVGIRLAWVGWRMRYGAPMSPAG